MGTSGEAMTVGEQWHETPPRRMNSPRPKKEMLLSQDKILAIGIFSMDNQ